MNIRIASEVPSGSGVLVRLVAKEECSKLSPAPTSKEFSAAVGSVLSDRSNGVLYVGIGDQSKIDGPSIRRAVSSAALIIRKLGKEKAALLLGDRVGFAEEAVEGFVLGGYRYEAFLPERRRTSAVSSLAVVVGKESVGTVRKAVFRGQILGDSANMAREIANTPGNLLYPETLVEKARGLCRRRGLKFRVLDATGLKKGGFGGILAVGGGSARGPRLLAIEHRGGRKGEHPLVLVGKAITFDSGGISIKPAAGMEEMIFDKCGGMAVLGAMDAIAALGVKRNVVGILAAAENMPSGEAYRPGDIVTMYDGTTVEVVNTDAEGRMVLGDALGWAIREFKAGKMIDLATLTGACGVALGEHAAGLWSNEAAFIEEVQEAASQSGERVWPMPSFEEYGTQIRSSVATLKNSGGWLGGACTAAAFLRSFVGATPWAHLDIAYTSHRSKDQEGLASGATGFGVRTLVRLAESV